MATRLNRPVARETDVTHDARPIIVTLSSEGVILREKGRRKSFTLPYRRAFVMAARLEADATVAAKKSKRRVSRSLLRGR